MNALEKEIQARIQEFVSELTGLVRAAALQSVEEALGSGSTATRRSRGPGRPKTSAQRKPAARRKKKGRRVRRSSEELEQMAAVIQDYVRAHPGERLEEISVALEIDSGELKRPIANLMEAGKLRTTGQKRGTKYFSSRGASAGGAKGRAKKKTKRTRKAK